MKIRFLPILAWVFATLLIFPADASTAIEFSAQSADVTGLRFVMMSKSAWDENEDGLIDGAGARFGACAEGIDGGSRDTTPVSFQDTYFVLNWEITSNGDVLDSGMSNSISDRIPWETSPNGSCFGNLFWESPLNSYSEPGSNVQIAGTMQVIHLGANPETIATFEDSLTVTMHGGCPTNFVEDEWTWTKIGFMMSAGNGGVAHVDNRIVVLPIDQIYPPPGFRILPAYNDQLIGYGEYFDYDTGIWANLSEAGDWVPPENLLALADMNGCLGVTEFDSAIADGFESNCVLTTAGLMSATTGGCVVEYSVPGISPAQRQIGIADFARNGFSKSASVITPADGRIKPAPPSNLNAQLVGKKLKVTWKRPITSGNSKLKSYQVKVWSAAEGGKLLGKCTVTSSKKKCSIKLKKHSTVYISAKSKNRKAGYGPWSFPRLQIGP